MKDFYTGNIQPVKRIRNDLRYTIYQQPGDGNCFLHSIVHQLERIGNPTDIVKLRNLTQHELQTIVANFETAEGDSEQAAWTSLREEIGATDANHFVELMAQDGTYYNYPGILALAIALNLEIRVHGSAAVHSIRSPINSSIPPKVVNVLYSGGNHYDSIVFNRAP